MDKVALLNKFLRPHHLTWLTRSMCTPAAAPPPNTDPKSMSARHRPTDLQKFVLVWTKKYKTKEEIPSLVPADLIARSSSEARIKLSNRLMILTALASLGAIIAGKAAAKRGESVTKINKDFHAKYQEDYNRKQVEAAAK